MDAAIGPWTRRGIGFALGVFIVVALAAALVETARLVALVFIAILFASALAPLVDRLRARAPFGRATSAGVLFFIAGVLVVAVGFLERLQARDAPVGLEPGPGIEDETAPDEIRSNDDPKLSATVRAPGGREA
jgi:hypothetical protein